MSRFRGTYPFGETPPENGLYVEAKDSAGVVRATDLDNVFPNGAPVEKFCALLPTRGHLYRPMVDSPPLFQVHALGVTAEHRGEDGQPSRQHPAILDAPNQPGNVWYLHDCAYLSLFVMERPITDRALAAEAQRGAEILVERWLAEQYLAPREYRPKRFSEGYVVVPTAFDAWRPMPFSVVNGQRNVTAMRSRGFDFNPGDLASEVEEHVDG